MNMTNEVISHEFRFKKEEMNNSFIRKIDQNEFLSNKNKKVCTTLNYIEHFLTLVFAVNVCICISFFASLIDISKGSMSSTTGLNISAIIARVKNYKSIIKKNKKKRDEIPLLAKTNFNCIKGLISRSLTDT